MATLKFKTSIKCGGCVQTATNALNPITEIKHWEVDLESPDRILSVEADEDITEKVMDAIEGAGFTIEEI